MLPTADPVRDAWRARWPARPLVVAAITALLACACDRSGSAPGRAGDVELRKDFAAAADLDRVAREIEATRFCTQDQLDILEALQTRFPASQRVRAALESAYIMRHDWYAGVALYEAVPIEERTPRDLRSLAGFCLKVGRFTDAAAILGPLVAASPQDAQLANLAAQAYYGGGDIPRAAAVLETAWPAVEARRDVEAFRLRGLVELERGEREEGRAWLERCVALQPDYAPGRYALSLCLASEGDSAGAQREVDLFQAILRRTQEEDARRMRMSALAQELRRTREAGNAEEFERIADEMLALADAPLRDRVLRVREEARREFVARGITR